ncbi:hypothetical protein [Mesorhizobium sp.]|uniref:hypothetical protein n=1 Tax=Mesorhizobium sp. TaxID=1871066 RepID=UPI00257B8613|nr:hypothetical protein [Mesorhizobium sp.]
MLADLFGISSKTLPPSFAIYCDIVGSTYYGTASVGMGSGAKQAAAAKTVSLEPTASASGRASRRGACLSLSNAGPAP